MAPVLALLLLPAPASVDLAAFTWFPLKPVAGERAAIGVARAADDGAGRRVATLQIGRAEGAGVDNPLLVVDADCAGERLRRIDAFSVDHALTTATPVDAALAGAMRVPPASDGGGAMLFDDYEALGAALRWACDDDALAVARAVPLADLKRKDSFTKRGN
ncbi:hypothetical protein [Sphingomonas flavalba]|uniref:hypothetical protein n=1 Tax=Sphingomonas flavalba TaxID=2559804 RepID=UPI00109E1192|nr:hypothetical protein [Sphingomonas flavalba]